MVAPGQVLLALLHSGFVKRIARLEAQDLPGSEAGPPGGIYLAARWRRRRRRPAAPLAPLAGLVPAVKGRELPSCLLLLLPKTRAHERAQHVREIVDDLILCSTSEPAVDMVEEAGHRIVVVQL